MNLTTTLIELMLSGFFAVACLRACVRDNPDGALNFKELLRFPGRIERLRRSRWQWFSMVALLLAVRLQMGLPLVVEILVATELVIFLALPVTAEVVHGSRGSGNAAVVGHR